VASLADKSGKYLTLNKDITNSLFVNYSNTQAMINSEKVGILKCNFEPS
jgi:phage gpG-like protein